MKNNEEWIGFWPLHTFHLTFKSYFCILILHLLIYQSVAPNALSRRKNSVWSSVVRQQRHRKEDKLRQNIDTLQVKSTEADETAENYYSLGWARWSEWSSCSKSCGNEGVQYQLRRCLDMYCSGPPSRHRLCGNKDCPQESLATKSDAKIECALRNKSLNGTLPEIWTPYIPVNNCSLVCRSQQSNKIRHIGVLLKDGSECQRDDLKKAACLSGKCQIVGCDDIIGSTARLDQCGQCNGDGSSCAKTIFRWKDTLQFTPCDKTCGANSVRVSVSVCINTITQRVVPERLCADQTRPRPQLRKCPHIVCPAKWLAGSWTDCSVSCGSGEQHRDAYCVESYILEQIAPSNSTNLLANTTKHTVENRKVTDQYCWQQQKPITERSCGAQCPAWQVGDWNQCSVSCGKGIRRRNVECMQGSERTEDFLCNTAKRPIQSQPCYTGLSCSVFKDSLNDHSPPLTSSTLDLFRFQSAFSPNTYQTSNEVGLSDSSVLQQYPHSAANELEKSSSRLQDISSSFQEDEEGSGKPRFHPSKWSKCSTSCGPGVRSRTVECVAYQGITADIIKLPDYECDGQTKPTLFQPCHGSQCDVPPPQSLSSLSALTSSSFPSNNMLNFGGPDSLAEFSSRVTTTHGHRPNDSGGGGNGLYRWDYGEWGTCSASCLGGKQKSTLKCMDLNRKQSVPWSFCNAKPRPIELSRSCNKQACPPIWDISEFSQCSHSCNGGIRTRRVRCIRKVSRVGGAESTLILPEEQCPRPKPNDQDPCGLENCPAAWKIDQWSPCSASCGDGEQRRLVECEQVDVLGTVRVFNPPIQCAAVERPPTVQLCNMGSCEDMRQPRFKPPSAMPLVQKYMNDDPRLDYDHVDPSREESQSQKGDYYEQSQANHKKLTLNVGGYANLYEGTSIKVKCPVRNFDRQRIYWTKDSKKLVNNAHTKVSSNGALRIFHARMEDAGLYACFADGVHGNVTLKFKHREAGGNKQLLRSNETKQKLAKESGGKVNNRNASFSSKLDKELLQKIRTSLYGLGEYRVHEKLNSVTDPSRIKVDFAVGEWSQCSQQECGKPDGAQVRMLKCQVYIDQLNAYVEDDICEGLRLTRPPATRPCKDPTCPNWQTSEWSECGESRCIRHATALQRREVKCVYTNGTEAEFRLCDRKNRPKIKKECSNLNCTAEWRPSVWGKCSTSCGDGGVQMRLLRCVWHGTKKAAGRNCDPIQRPSAIRACEPNPKAKACEAVDKAAPHSMDGWPKEMTEKNSTMSAQEKEECEDKSRFCDILKLFHSCDQERIRTRCCYSCHFLDFKNKV